MFLLKFFSNKSKKIIFLIFVFSFNFVGAIPINPVVINGEVVFSDDNNQLDITCSDNSIIHWDSFSLSSSESVSFLQPSSNACVLNKVIGSDPSNIFGKVLSNGVLFLLNPNGILFGSNAQIDVGSLFASTLNLPDLDFLNKTELNFSGESTNGIVNLANIHASNNVFLISKKIENSSCIQAGGKIGFCCGKNILIKPNESDSVYIIASTCDDKDSLGINNSGNLNAKKIEIKADGNLYELAIKNESNLDAISIQEIDGEIYLIAKDGSIEINNSNIKAQKNLNGGIIAVAADNILIGGSSKLDVSNGLNGGIIDLGIIPNDSTYKAHEIIINENVSLDASSKEVGNGGQIDFISSDKIKFLGRFLSNGQKDQSLGGTINIESEILNLDANILSDLSSSDSEMRLSLTTISDLDNELSDIISPSIKPANLYIKTSDVLVQSILLDNHSVLTANFLNENLKNNNIQINTKSSLFTNGNINVLSDIKWVEDHFLNLIGNEIYINGSINNKESLDYHDSLSLLANKISINSMINVGFNNLLVTLENDLAILNLNDFLIGKTVIRALGKNNVFNININPNIYPMEIDGGIIDNLNSLINNNNFSKWNVYSENEGVCGAIKFKNINYIEADRNDDVIISAPIKEVKLKDNANATINGNIQTLRVDSSCSSIDMQNGYISEVYNINGKNIYFLNGGSIDKIYCLSGNDYFYFSSGDILSFISVDQANAYFNFISDALIHGSIQGGSKINQLNYYIYNSKIDVDLNLNKATCIEGSISNINSIIGDKRNFGKITLSDGINTCKLNNNYAGIINNEIYFSNISDIYAQNSDNTFNIHGSLDTILGGNNNIYNFYSDGNIFDTVDGGAIKNEFNFFANSQIEGRIIGKTSFDVLNYQNYNSKVFVDFNSKTATGIGGFENIKTFIANENYAGEFLSDTNESFWKINGKFSGLINDEIGFSNFDTLKILGKATFYLQPNGYIDYIYSDLQKDFYLQGGDVGKIVSSSGENKFLFFTSDICRFNLQSVSGNVIFDYSNYLADVNIDFSKNQATSYEGNLYNLNRIIGNFPNYVTSIIGDNKNTIWTIDGLYQGNLSVDDKTTYFQNVNDIFGGMGNNNFYLKENSKIKNIYTGNLTNNIYLQTGDVEQSIYSSGLEDTYFFENNSQISGSILGVSNVERTFDYSNYGSKISIDLQNNKASGVNGTICFAKKIIGDRAFFGTFIAKDTDPFIYIDGINHVSTDLVTFENFDTINSGLINSVFYMYPDASVKNINGNVTFYNTLDYSNYSKPIFIDLDNMKSSGIESSFSNINWINFNTQN